MSMEKLKCPTCEHYRLCSIGVLTDNRARTCKAYHMSKVPIPSAPRHIYSPVDHYDVDVETGTVTYHVVRTNGDRIRSMTDEELAEEMSVRLSEDCLMCPVFEADCPVWMSKDIECKDAMLEWLKEEVKDG